MRGESFMVYRGGGEGDIENEAPRRGLLAGLAREAKEGRLSLVDMAQFALEPTWLPQIWFPRLSCHACKE